MTVSLQADVHLVAPADVAGKGHGVTVDRSTSQGLEADRRQDEDRRLDGDSRLTAPGAAELARTAEPVALLLALARAMGQATGDALDGRGGTAITLTQLRALRILQARPRSITDLAKALGSHRSSTSRLVDRLSRPASPPAARPRTADEKRRSL